MKKTFASVLALLLVLCLALPASASSGDFLMDQYDVTEDHVHCYAKAVPAGGTLSVSIGTQTVESAVISTLAQEEIPVTVYCLVDISSSVSESLAQQQEAFLLTLSSKMREQDNMVLGLVDRSLYESQLLQTKAERDTAIETIQRQVWYTNLYQGLSACIDSVRGSTALHTNRCVVVLSDGHDDGKTDVTGDDVVAKIQDAGIPVYTVMLGTTNTSERDLRYQQQFAEVSFGGAFLRPGADRLPASTVAEQVWTSILSASTIRVDRDEIGLSESDQQMLVRYQAENALYEDTVTLRAVDVAVPTVPAMTVPPFNRHETEATEASEGDDEASFPLLQLVLGGAALIAIGVAIFLLARKKPKTGPDIPNPDPAIIPGDAPQDRPDDWGIFSVDTDTASSGQAPITEPVSGGCTVTAVAIMHPEVQIEFQLPTKVEITFGRTSSASIVLNAKDKKLSGVHGSFLWDGKRLFARDKGSRNGTVVDDAPCSGEAWLKVENGSVIRVGSYAYRISFKDNEQ